MSPASVLRPRHWVYLDDQRTHEVHAQVAPRLDEILLATTEFPAGSRDPAEAVVAERQLSTMEQLDLAMRELEERLAFSGTYYRADVADMQWSLVAPPAGARRLDLRAREVPLPGSASPSARMGFHHFHGGSKSSDALLITLPREDLGGTRSILAKLDFQFPHAESGQMQVLHTRLSPGTLRSTLVREHMALPSQGYAKLFEPRDYEQAFGAGWLDRTREVFRLAASRVLSLGRTPTVAPPPVERRPAMEARSAREALAHPRVAALRARFLDEGEREELFWGGELAIRRFIQGKRRRADHSIVYELAVLESALLVEYGVKKDVQALLDEEGPKLVRFANAPAPRRDDFGTA